ncbi:MAG TPA: ATP-binding protein [Gammaproteobacteria bacterium]|nr:ATP-binding protein [Gammaproteobacteria bacterium]
MISALSIDEVLALIRNAPEQPVLDCKREFVVPDTDEKRGELLKDIAAVANAAALSHGFILYGVDPQRPDPVVGITNRYDDAKLQQLVDGKIEPRPEFLYYEVSAGPRTIGVLHVAASKRRPHIIRVDLGKVRKGQIVVRRGSSTDGATLQDLFSWFYGSTSGYFPQVYEKLGFAVRQQEAQNEYLAHLQRGVDRAEDDIWQAVGLPPLHRR